MSLCFSLSLSFSLPLYLSLSCSEDLVAVAPWWLASWPWSSARRLTLQRQSKLQSCNLTLWEAQGQRSLGRQKKFVRPSLSPGLNTEEYHRSQQGTQKSHLNEKLDKSKIFVHNMLGLMEFYLDPMVNLLPKSS